MTHTPLVAHPTRIETFCTSGTSPTFTLTGPVDAPCILVLGGISAPADLSWWPAMVGPDCALDPTRYRLLSVDFEGLSTRDQARRILTLLDALGIDRLHAAIGCSYGGMVCLALATDAPERVRHLILIGAAHRPHALAQAWRLVQRRILDLGVAAGAPAQGVALARCLAMATYRTDRELDARFDETTIVDWLDHHGDRASRTVTAARYHALSAAIDSHRTDPQRLTVPTTLIGFDSDQLVPPWLLQEFCVQAAGPVDLTILPSIHGHDAFLLDTKALAGPVRAALGVPQ